MLHILATGMYIPYLGKVEEDFKREVGREIEKFTLFIVQYWP